jgi:hypothetical protein
MLIFHYMTTQKCEFYAIINRLKRFDVMTTLNKPLCLEQYCLSTTNFSYKFHHIEFNNWF